MKHLMLVRILALVTGACLVFSSCSEDDDSDSSDGDSLGNCEWGWGDSTSGLCWQNPPSSSTMFASDAVTHCEDMTFGGHNDWRLPDIDELRSLIRGCEVNGSDGACGVTDPGCLNKGTCRDGCTSCAERGGPGKEGCYWDGAIDGPCTSKFWSSSTVEADSEKVWFVNFADGDVSFNPGNSGYSVRCVR